MQDTLENLRKEIDIVDKQIISLLAKRMDVVQKVGVYKAKQNIKPLDTGRWQEVLLSKMNQAKQQNLSEELVKDIYERIHKEALRIEGKV